MDDLISRQDAINAICNQCSMAIAGDRCTNSFCKDVRVILELPSAQHFVEVVRCKDCSEWQTDWIPSCGDNGSHYCATMDLTMKPNDYCSYGERKTNE